MKEASSLSTSPHRRNGQSASLLGIALFSLLAACKPPPTDADLARDMPAAAPSFASDPLPSPETEGAVWALSPQAERRIIYGVPGEPALIALECIEDTGELPSLQITRLSPADEGAGALLALVGNGHIGRIAVDARDVGGRDFWQGDLQAAATQWEPLTGPRQLTVTVPGAGMVTVNPSTIPGELIEACRTGEPLVLTPAEETDVEEADVEEDANEENPETESSPSP